MDGCSFWLRLVEAAKSGACRLLLLFLWILLMLTTHGFRQVLVHPFLAFMVAVLRLLARLHRVRVMLTHAVRVRVEVGMPLFAMNLAEMGVHVADGLVIHLLATVHRVEGAVTVVVNFGMLTTLALFFLRIGVVLLASLLRVHLG